MLSLKFNNDNNIILNAPEQFLINDQPYRWYAHFLNSTHLERKTRQIVSELLNTNLIDKNKNIVDSGAFVGDNSLPWAKNINGKVYAIDPSDSNKCLINHLCDINNINNVVFIQTTLSDKVEELTYNGDLDFNSFIYAGDKKTTATSLDVLYKDNQIDNIDFIHFDVEGMEYKALVGSKTIIEYYNPIIIYEQHIKTDNYSEILNFLEKYNYISYIIDEQTGVREDCRNFLSISREKHKSFLNKFNLLNFCIHTDEISKIYP